MSDYWYAMCCAPRDGTVVILLYDDFSGVELAHWAEFDNPREVGDPTEAWFHVDGHDELGQDEDWAGWIPAPTKTPRFNRQGT